MVLHIHTYMDQSNIFLHVDNCSMGCADVVFLVDGSGSIGATDFAEEINFVADLIDSLPSDVHSGVIVFSSNVEDMYSLTNNPSSATIRSLNYPGGGTSIGNAITVAIDEFTMNGRSGCVDHLIVLTDGISGDDVTLPSTDARTSGIITYSIGIGGRVDQAELLLIAGHHSRLFNASISSLRLLHNDITNGICNSSRKLYLI